MSTAVIFWTILGSVVGIGCLFVLVAYLVWRFYLHPKGKADRSDSFFEEITETEIKTVTSHPPDGATVVTKNVRTRTRSSRPRDRSESVDSGKPKMLTINPDENQRQPILVTPWSVPSLMNNWRESEDDFVKLMAKSNFKQLPWKPNFSQLSPDMSKSRMKNKSEDKMEIVELT